MMRPTGEDAGGELDSLDPPIEILDPQLARELQECRCWIESVTGKQFGNKDFRTALEDGTLLCKLMQTIQPGSIKKINNLPTPYAKLDNLNLFLRACLDLGLTRNQLFEPSDLTDLTTKERRDPEEERNRLKNVAITLYWLGKTSEEFPSFPGPYLNRDMFRNVNIQSPSSTMDIYGAPPSGNSHENVYSYKHRPQDSIDSTISQDSSSSVDRGQLSGSLDSDDQQDPRVRMGDDMMSRRAAGYLPRPLKKRISESHMFLPPKGGFLSKSNPELNKTYPMGRRKSSGGEIEEEEDKSLTYEDYKKEKTKLSEDSDLWRSTLDTWKLRRKSKSSADLWAKKEEWEKDKVAELDTTTRRKSKTFQEIVDEKGGPDIGDVAIQLLRKKREQELSDEYAAALDERERAENDDNVFNGEDSEPPARSWRPQPQPRNLRREDPWSDDEQPSRNVPSNKRRPSPPPRQDSFQRGPFPPPREDSIPKSSPAKPSWQRPEPSRQQPTQSWQRPEPSRQRSDQSWQRPEPSWQRPPPPKPSARNLPDENKENSESVSNIRSMWQRMEQEEPKEKELPRVPRKFEPTQPIWARDSPPAQPIRGRDSPPVQPIRARDSSPAQPIRASQSPLSRMTAKQKMEEVANRPVRWEYKEGYMVTNLNLSKSSDEKGFGFAVSGGKDDKAPVLISSVVPGGSAARSQLQVGDEILAINEEDVSPFNHNTVVAAIRDSAKTGIISLYIRREGAEQNAFASLAKELEANDGFPDDEPDSPAPPPRPPPPVEESPVVRQEKVRVDQTALSQQLNRLEDEVKEEPITPAVKARDDGSLAERIDRLEGEVMEEPVTRAVKARDDGSLAERIERLDKSDRKDGTWQSKEWRVDPPGQHMEISLLKDDPELQPKPEVVLRRRDTESELASQNLKRRSDFFLGVDPKAEEKPPPEVEKLQSKLTSYTPPQIETGYKPLESRPRSYNLEDERNRLAEWQRSQEQRQKEQFQKQQEQFKVDYENRLKKSIERKKSDPALLYAPKPWASVKPPVSKPFRPSASAEEDDEAKTLQDRSSWEQQQLQLREQQRKEEEEQQRKLAAEQQRREEEEQQRRWEEEQQRKREAEEQRRKEEEEQQMRWEEEQQRQEEEQQRKLAEEQRQKEEEEQQRRWEEEQQRRREEEQQRKFAEEQQRKEEEEQQRRWEEEEKRRQEEEDRRRWEEEEEERRWQAEQERKREEEHAQSRVENGEPDAGDQFYYEEKEQQPPAEGQRWDDEEEKRAEQMMLQEEEEFMREQEEMRQKAELERQRREEERRRIEQHRLEIENQRARLQQASQDHSPVPPAVLRPSPQPRQPPQDRPEEEWDAEEERARIEAAAKQHQRLMEEEERRRRQRRAEEQDNRRMEEAGNVPDIRPLPRGPQERPGSENQPHWLIEEAERRRLQDQTGQPRAPGIIEPLPPLVKPQPKNRHSVHGPPTGPPSHPPPDVPRRIHPNRSDEDVQARMINRRSAPPERTSQGPIPDHIKDALTQRATRPQQSPPSRPVGGGKSVSGRKLCTHCGEPLGRGAAMIIESLALFYHITCFRCSVCGIQLGNGQQGTDVRIRANALHCSNCYSNEKGDAFTAV